MDADTYKMICLHFKRMKDEADAIESILRENDIYSSGYDKFRSQVCNYLEYYKTKYADAILEEEDGDKDEKESSD